MEVSGQLHTAEQNREDDDDDDDDNGKGKVVPVL
jgi:hypothetical protein